MKCRRIVKDPYKDKQNIVWFGSAGIEILDEYPVIDTIPLVDLYDERFEEIGPDPVSIWIRDCYCDIDNSIDFSFDTTIPGEIYIYTLNKNGDLIELETMQEGSRYYNFEPNEGEVYDNIIFLNIPGGTPQLEYFKGEISYTRKVKQAIKVGNYSEKQEAVRNSLIQRLSIIKGELWYKASYGLPLMDKIKNKGIYDSVIINIISEHPDVKAISYFNSEIEDHTYKFDFVVISVFDEEISVSYKI